MKIIYSNLSLVEVKDIRNKIINDSVVGAVQTSIIIMIEKLLLTIAYCLEAVLVVAMLCKAYFPVCRILAKRMTELQLNCMPALFLLTAVIIIRTLWMVTEKGHKTLVVKMFPEKTLSRMKKNMNLQRIQKILKKFYVSRIN